MKAKLSKLRTTKKLIQKIPKKESSIIYMGNQMWEGDKEIEYRIDSYSEEWGSFISFYKDNDQKFFWTCIFGAMQLS